MSDILERLNHELIGRFRVERELGAGGMATVYLATDLKHDRRVAVKVLRPELAASVGAERFLREIRITAGLQHPHILQLIDSGELRAGPTDSEPGGWGGSLPYYVMPFVDGESLRARLDREKQLPIPDALAIAHTVADALAFAHNHGVVHRDIKPENILLGENGPTIADFGIARALEPTAGRVTETGLSVGTPGYMSPEQAVGDQDITPRSDVYSLGCMLYEMLVGEPPYTGPTPQAILARAISGAIPVASRTRETVPDAVDQVISRALAKAPADRFPNGAAFAEALARAEAAPVGRRSRGNRRVFVGLGAAVLAAAAVVVAVALARRPSVASSEVPGLVVLPFENLGAPDDSGFADGVTDEITARMADVKEFAVKARQSAMAYRGTRKTPQQIGRELGVDFVLQATLSWERRADGQRRVRVRPKLIRTRDANQMWATTFDEDLTEVFVVQEKIAKQVVAALAPALVAQAGDARVGRTDAQSYYATALTRAIPTDPELRVGTLANGLRYYIRANAEPRRRADFRLVINGGSMVEGDGEHGYMHLLEHMMIDGSPLFEGKLIRYLTSVGVRYGYDMNGGTSFGSSWMFMHVPTQRAVLVDSAVRILRSWASDIHFDSTSVGHTRRIVMEEWRASQSAENEVGSRMVPALLREVPPAAHHPIGDTATILHVTPGALARFAEAWYRPDRMAVIVVGDFSADSIEMLIRHHFADFKRGGSHPTPPAVAIADRRDTRVSVLVSDRVAPTINVVYMQPADTQRTIGSYREAVVQRLLVALLTSRLSERALDPQPPFLGAGASRSSIATGVMLFALGGSVADSGHARALEGLLVEGERTARHGFTDREVTRGKAELLRRMQQAYDERGKRQSGDYASEYATAFEAGAPVPGTAFEYGLFKRFLPTISAAEIQALARQWLVDRNRTVVAIMRSSPATRTAEADLHAALETARVADIAAYHDRVDTASLPSTTRGGKIVKTEGLADVGVTIWSLGNGARVMVKPTDFKGDEIQFQAFRRGGTSLADDNDYRSAALAPTLVARSGFATIGVLDLRRTLSDKIVELVPSMSEARESLTGRTSPKDLEAFLQVVALHFTQPRVDSAAYLTLVTQARAAVVSRAANPALVLQDTLAATLANGTRRLLPLTDAAIGEVDLRKALDLFRSRFADATGFTFVFVGSFDVATLKPLVEKYLGGLPSSARPARARDVSARPLEGVVRKTVHVGGASQAQVAIVFTGTFDYSDSARQAIRSIADLLTARLTETLREQLGGAFNATAGSTYDNEPRPTYRIQLNFVTSAERVDELTSATLKIIEDLSTRGPMEADLARVREAQHLKRDSDLRVNQVWAGQLSAWARGGMDPRRLANFALIDGQTVAGIRDAAHRYLPLDRYVMVRVVP